MIKMYTTDCSRCKILEKKLIANNIDFEKITDVEIISKLNILSVPVLEIDGEFLNFSEAINWIRVS